MLSVCLDISQVVEAVDAAGDETKRHKYDSRRHEVFRLQQIVAEENRRKDEGIFKPLQRTEELDIVYHLVHDLGDMTAKIYFFSETAKHA